MANHKAEAKFVGKPRLVKTGYRSIDLTENEAKNAITIYTERKPEKLFVSTKRPEAFPQGMKVRFRNKMCAYGWTIDRHERLDFGRTHIVLLNAKELSKSVTATRKVAIHS